jgi:N-acetylmuramic acid 6-phosphate etherase
MTFIKTTELDSHYNHLEKMSIKDVLKIINQEDQKVPDAVAGIGIF